MRSGSESIQQDGGFTLTELLVVIGIMGVLMGLIFPVLGRARKSAREANCKVQIKQLAIEVKRYENDWRVHPPWLSTLYPNYLSERRLLLCPSDYSRPKGSQGARPDGLPPPFDQFAELDDNKDNSADESVYAGLGRMSPSSEAVSANSLRNPDIEGCSYSYEFACPKCSYWGGDPYPDALGNADGVVSWREVKIYVEQDGYTNAQKARDKDATYGGRVPLIRCFWHSPCFDPNRLHRTRVINYAVGDHNIYISDATKDGWKDNTKNF